MAVAGEVSGLGFFEGTLLPSGRGAACEDAVFRLCSAV